MTFTSGEPQTGSRRNNDVKLVKKDLKFKKLFFRERQRRRTRSRSRDRSRRHHRRSRSRDRDRHYHRRDSRRSRRYNDESKERRIFFFTYNVVLEV